MATPTVADYLLDRLRDWDVEQGLRLRRRRHQRHPRRLGPGRQRAPVHPGPARGDGRVRGRRLRQVHRPGRRLHGHLRARAPSTCSTGCTTPSSTTCPWSRSSARPAAVRDGRLLPAGSRPAAACSRTSPASTCRWSPCPSSCPTCWTGPSASRWPSGRPTAIIIPSDVQELDYSRADPRVQDGALQRSASTGPTAVAGRRRHRPGRRDPQRRQQGRDPGRARAPAAPGASSSRSPSCSAPGWPSRCSARTCSPTSCRT